MKTRFTSQEIAHVWAHKSAPHGKSPGAMSFEGNAMFSYGTEIARHIEHKGQPAIILNVTSYSVSTSKHQGRINMAIHGLAIPVFRVDGIGMGASLRFTGDELFTRYIEQAARCEADSRLPRIRPHTVEAHKGRAAHFLAEAKRVSEFFGLRRKVDEGAITRLADAKARAEKRARIEQEKRDAAERERQQSAYAAWMASEPMPEGVYLNARLFPVAFRVEGEELVSTLGARVPLTAARAAYRFVTSKRFSQWQKNGETCPVGNYAIDAVNTQGVVAGCHRITWAEIERLTPILAG